jgi:hypothetical protein
MSMSTSRLISALLCSGFGLFGASPVHAATFSVTSTADSGANTLRQAILDANANGATADTINFAIAGSGPFTISLLSALPAISSPTTIDASAEAISGAPGVRIARSAGFVAPGLQFAAGANGSSVSYLSITDFAGHGIDILVSSVSVSNCFVGLAPDGVTDAGNNSSGIRINGASAVIGSGTATRNVISGNGQYGILVEAAGDAAAIRGNRIGTNAAGTAAVPNGFHGIGAAGGSGVNVGGTAAGQGNVISGNTQLGVNLASPTDGWNLRGNLIGTTITGTAALPNGTGGINVIGDNHFIGFNDATGRNVISGNNPVGITVNAGADNITIRANHIGTNGLGTASLGTQTRGINIVGAVTGCVIGGTSSGERNVISGNLNYGVISAAAANNCTISGNYIGTDATGAVAVANGTGVELRGENMLLGGDSVGERNIISGNTVTGVTFWGSTNSIKGNFIGTNATGTSAIGNGAHGIGVSATGGTIGGTAAGEFNLISGNGSNGINFATASGVLIVGNQIGTNAAGSAAIPNGSVGVWLRGNGHTLGGTTAAARNLISGNDEQGVILQGTSNTVAGNYIGTNAAGTAAIANGSGGIRAITATGGTIGGSVSGAGNLISGNASNGISLDGDTSAFVIAGNLIGTNAAGTAALANVGSGIAIGGSNHTIGGTTAAARNLISGNTFQGVVLQGTGNVVRGNYIGTNLAGAAAIPNTSGGIRAISTTSGTIGGATAGAGNLISGNSSNGILLDANTSALLITGNLIGTNAAGSAAVPNQGSGVSLGGTGHTLGGNTAAARNLITGNGANGVTLGGSNNLVHGNYIGTNAAGTGAIGNGGYGVRIYAATGGELGGDTFAKGNLISGNGRGVSLEQGSTDVVLRNNIIGLNASMLNKLPNHGTGVEIYSSGNTVGTAGNGNVIAGSDYSGVVISGHASGNLIQGNWIGTNMALASGLGNTIGGIYITDGFDNFIGGPGAGEGNVIAYNGYVGALIDRGDGNDFSRNSIFLNDRLGIDVGDLGLALNDAGDADIAGNRRQNFPLLTSVVAGATTEIDGVLNNEPNTLYRVELFTSPTCDVTGFGEGTTYFGTVDVLTGPDGSGVINASMASTAAPFMSANVTDPFGNTSEFSPCARTTGPNPGTIQFYNASVLSYEGVLPTAKVVITRSHGMAGTVTANFAVSDLSAQAVADYVDSDQVVTFLDGEVIKIIEIPIVADAAVEASPEHANLNLTAPGGGATLGTSFSDLYIFDEDVGSPGITIADVSLTEGNSGEQQMTFNVRLSASDHEVTVSYLTEPGTAVAGQDYTDVTGTLTFPASANAQVQTVNVPVIGDDIAEADDIVWMRISTALNGGNWIAYDTYGLGLIINDDGIVAPVDPVFADGFE